MAFCRECGEEIRKHTFIQLESLKESFSYTIPSFPVFQVKIKHIKFSFLNDSDVYDGFIQDATAGELKDTSILKLCGGYTNAFLIESNEFDRCVDVKELKLLEEKVFVIWKWNLWYIDEEENASAAEDTSSIEDSSEVDEAGMHSEGMEYILSEVDEGSDAPAESLSSYSVVFKCIGSMKEQNYQDVLANAALSIRKKVTIGVRLTPEPANPVDAKAIAFELFVDDRWKRVGYMVTEVLDSVHQAINNNSIISTDLEWVKFITHWSRSAPGWYCGIKITRTGPWDNQVLRCRSTI